MRLTHLTCASLALSLLAAPQAMATANSRVIVGISPAHGCYRSVQLNRRDAGSVAECDLALEDAFLPRDVRATTLLNRAVLHLRRHESRQALADANEAISLPGALNQEDSARAYFYRGNADEDLGLNRAAYDDYRHAADLNPSWAAPRTELTRFQVR